ncbi:MAG: WbqC family protein [Balneolales bacterium]
MKLAIMQPYIFPYVGYFQLIQAVDKLVLLDDVHYIKKGWINRNKLLVDGKPYCFSIPLERASQNRLIKDIKIVSEVIWKKKLLKTIEFSYRCAPYFNNVYPIIQEILYRDEVYISRLIYITLNILVNYIGIHKEIVPSSVIYNNRHLKSQDKIIDICRQEKASLYINSSGGKSLYDKSAFDEYGIELSFINPGFKEYEQNNCSFIPGLSIIDVLMYNSPSESIGILENYSMENRSRSYSEELKKVE